MMRFHEDPEPESDRMFWAIMFAMILLAMFFIMGIFVSFYLKII
jgi:cell division septal protein FtsQ